MGVWISECEKNWLSKSGTEKTNSMGMHSEEIHAAPYMYL